RACPPLRRFRTLLSAGLGGLAPRGFRLWELNAGLARFGQPDRDRLLGRSRSVLAAADVIHFLADELASLGRRRLAFAFVFACSLGGALFCHNETPYAKNWHAAFMTSSAIVHFPTRWRVSLSDFLRDHSGVRRRCLRPLSDRHAPASSAAAGKYTRVPARCPFHGPAARGAACAATGDKGRRMLPRGRGQSTEIVDVRLPVRRLVKLVAPAVIRIPRAAIRRRQDTSTSRH